MSASGPALPPPPAVSGAQARACSHVLTFLCTEDITTLLDLQDPTVISASFNRPDIEYQVVTKPRALSEAIAATLQMSPDAASRPASIVYCATQKETEKLAADLTNNHGISALPYHGGLTAEQRRFAQGQWTQNQTQVICATVAFGMGAIIFT
ncbi:hypothetical protein H696_00304 [Fonticula alba]|uniref:DNA 3'-5' helicase n=1 Tax=Fonticula alba TaxID=691883 RepID=A0A058ZFJ6_FONAL|nr:hypothetical protein H696_00304 [Fonticula alba]KCV72726.1 hypothetical protein H696_00304 [Fonticula alba]|eukprot:XP_009492427.1 hypothetical protein H696_00304 [Fonticula alba]